MSNIEPYIIIGQEIANIEIGSIKKPKFFKITSGERQKKSLLYHAKIPPVSFPVLINYLKTTIRPNLPNLKLKFDEFFVYLEKNYLRVDSKFKPSIWSNFNSVHDLQDPENGGFFQNQLF